MSRGVAISNAVVDELNNPSRPWFSKFTATKQWGKTYDVEKGDLKVLTVAVLAATLASEKADRRPKSKESYRIVIDFEQLVATNPQSEEVDNAMCDGLDAIAEQVWDFFQNFHYLTTTADVTGGAGGTWKVLMVERPEIFDFAFLLEDRIWNTQIYLMVEGTI